MTDEPRKPIGFAALTPERMREIASMGGKAQKNRTFTVRPDVAVKAGRISGKKRRKPL